MGSPEDEDGRWENEGPQHVVRIETGFWMFETQCTQAMWEAVMGTNPSYFKGSDKRGLGGHPVENVSWGDCEEFLARLNGRLEGLELSLPSEAQWEYACRAGTEGPRYHEDLGAIAWYDGNSEGQTHAVGQKLPNAWGLYDMLGNVWEWCADVWRKRLLEERDSDRSASSSARRVIRGGSWVNVPQVVRAASRNLHEPTYRYVDLGFRCAESRGRS
jgi:formylglycine-generating enzyme required for sulfatase activity